MKKTKKYSMTKNIWDYRLDIVSYAFGKFFCNFNCFYCHKDYFFTPSVTSKQIHCPLSTGVELCNLALPGSYSIHLAGAGEPLLVPQKAFSEIITPFQSHSLCEKISITTNGYYLSEWVETLIKSKISDINVSLPTLSKRKYSQIMKIDIQRSKTIINRVITGIILASKNKLSTDINVCISYQFKKKELSKFLEFSNKHNVKVKFFSLIETNGNGALSKKLFDNFIELISSFGNLKPISNRNYSALELENSNLLIKTDQNRKRPMQCKTCSRFSICKESCWESIRISPWYIMPCSVRKDNIYWYKENNLESLRKKLDSGGKISNG